MFFKEGFLLKRILRVLVMLIMVAVIFFGYLRTIQFYHERRVVRNLRLIELAMEKYKQKNGSYPKYGEIWRTTEEVNTKLGLSIKDDVFGYQCFGWFDWTSFRCETKSPLYDWSLHFHEGVAAHCLDNSCPSCTPSHDSKGGC
ncbi:MAG: hypothetical protein AB7S78_09695 [Candidatus Omnitrophota bacterium]